jgi:hypothetical protein
LNTFCLLGAHSHASEDTQSLLGHLQGTQAARTNKNVVVEPAIVPIVYKKNGQPRKPAPAKDFEDELANLNIGGSKGKKGKEAAKSSAGSSTASSEESLKPHQISCICRINKVGLRVGVRPSKLRIEI